MIESITQADAEAVAAIYNPYIAETTVTFELDAVPPEAMAERIAGTTGRYPWIGWREHGELLGYAYLTRFRDRAAYDHAAESSVYLRPGAEGRGIGTALYRRLIALAPGCGVSRIIGVIALPNDVSEKLHAALGFRHCGVLEGVGRKFGREIDTAYWQLTVEGVRDDG
jgi:phosphinothricin acetyltransferase